MEPKIVNQYGLLRDAKVEVTVVNPANKHPQAQIIINDQVQHIFSPKSRVSRALETMTPQELQARLSGGQFFIVNNKLIDFRDSHYDGFIHTDANIDALMESVGARETTARERRGLRATTQLGDIMLANRWSQQDIQVEGYKEGGAFSSHLLYQWSPFHQYVRGVFELVRLICTNGMIGSSDIFNARIPVINRWEEHLEIAARQIQNKVESRVSTRLRQMGHERASVAELQLIAAHAENRMVEMDIAEFGSFAEYDAVRKALRNINMVASPEVHLRNHYKDAAFDSSSVAAQLPGHLSLFDAWNLVTEMYSHTVESASSSATALQKMANSMVFDGDKRDARLNRRDVSKPMLSSFSDADLAFFGKID